MTYEEIVAKIELVKGNYQNGNIDGDDMCEALGMDYDAVREGIVADSRIGKSHTNVPGIDNDRGFGGTCFPKDINSLIKQMESHNIDAEMLKKVWEYNQSIRSVVDWIVT